MSTDTWVADPKRSSLDLWRARNSPLTEDDGKRWDQLHSGVCLCTAHPPTPGILRRQRTSYAKEMTNWNCLCDPCWEEDDAYWDERWADYYAGR